MTISTPRLTGAKVSEAGIGSSLVEFCFPSYDLCSVEDLYGRYNELAAYSYTDQAYELSPQGVVQFDTYFNSFSVGRWKSICAIENLFLSIRFKGEVCLSFHLNMIDSSATVLHEVVVQGDGVSDTAVALPFWPGLEDGMVFLKVRALTPARVYAASYSTVDAPLNAVKLGLVVTTFNRQSYVLPAIERLKTRLFSDPRFHGKVSMVVVDNGRNLVCDSDDSVRILPNPNVGGAGGFTRGLIHFQDAGDFTHCLFMDDDATCEIESIRRSIRVFQYAKNPKISIAGSMLLEHDKSIQHECGAVYDNGFVKPVMNGLDMRRIHSLLLNETPQRIDYAAWWFYAFPIAIVTHYAFPFFVRGDDFTFGVQHAAAITAMNGIATWQEDFSNKAGPIVEYLSMRSLLASSLILDSGQSPKKIVQSAWRHIYGNNIVYRYDRSRALCEALADVLKGPDFWRDNADMVEKRAIIKNFVLDEIPVVVPEAEGYLQYPLPKHGRAIVRFFKYKLTLNGHLLPDFMLRDSPRKLDSVHGAVKEVVYRQKRVLYYNKKTRTGHWAKHSKKRFFENLFMGLRLYVEFRWRYKELRKAYGAAYPELTSRAFWEKWTTLPEAAKDA